MKKLLIIASLLLAAVSVKASVVTFDSESGRIVISTRPASPTQIFSAKSWINKTVILNDSGFNLVLSTSSTGISTNADTGNFYIPTGTLFQLDGSADYFSGDLYGVIVGTDVPKSIGRLRLK